MMSRRLALFLMVLVLVLGIGAGARDFFGDWVAATDLPPLEVPVGVEVLARDGSLLRAFQVADGRWRLDAGPVDPLFLDMLTLWEDKRFRRHAGVDTRAMLRAGGQALRHGRVVSGGSTLTMQVARLLEEGTTGEWGGKLRQMRLALALERRLDKAQIMALYLRLAPYGANVEGVRAASLQWFGKEPRRLTPAEAALLVALPQSPERRRPDRFPDAARAARDRVLARAAAAGLLSQADASAAMTEPVPRMRRAFPALAPLLAARLVREHPGATRIETTLDARLQRRAEQLASRAVRGAGRRLSAAIVLADHQSGEILAEVGAADWTDGASAGFVDMTRAWRSPGSTLKPFLYALAFETRTLTPASLIEDAPLTLDTGNGLYAPQNYEAGYRGWVSARAALGGSLNVPAVRTLVRVGANPFHAALQKNGFSSLRLDGEWYGYSLALGSADISLLTLANAYRTLANGGQWSPLKVVAGSKPRAPCATSACNGVFEGAPRRVAPPAAGRA